MQHIEIKKFICFSISLMVVGVVFCIKPVAADIDYTKAPSSIRVAFYEETGKKWENAGEAERVAFLKNWHKTVKETESSEAKQERQAEDDFQEDDDSSENPTVNASGVSETFVDYKIRRGFEKAYNKKWEEATQKEQNSYFRQKRNEDRVKERTRKNEEKARLNEQKRLEKIKKDRLKNERRRALDKQRKERQKLQAERKRQQAFDRQIREQKKRIQELKKKK